MRVVSLEKSTHIYNEPSEMEYLKEEFIKFTQRMLSQYETIHKETEDFSEEVSDITTMKYEMQSELAGIIRALQIDSEPVSEEKKETVYRVIQDKKANENIVEKIGDHVI